MAKHASEEGVVVGTSDGRRALLADFDVDQHALRPRHREWLDGLANIVRRSHLRPPHGIWSIEVVGRASKTGSNAHNAKLSDHRKTEVRLYLERRIGAVPVQWIEKALGEEAPFDAAIDENARDRSVEVFARPSVFIEPPRPRRDPERPPVADKTFDLVVDSLACVVGEGSFIRFTTWIMNITISDPLTDDTAQYSFEGSGTSAPVVTKGIVTSAQIKSVRAGGIQGFPASNRLTVDSFVGDAGLTVAASGPNQFRFGGNRLTDNTGPRRFPRGRVNDFVFPTTNRSLPIFASATGKLTRGIADVWF